MRTFKVWNKQDSINGVSAEQVLNSIQAHNNDEVFLVLDGYGNITQIEIVRIIKSVYKLDANLTVEQVAQAYLDIRQANDEKAIQDANTIEQQAAKIATLETQQANTEYILMMGGLI